MTDEPALLAAAAAAPDDDTPRLAYADWLDEHGQPERGEFIRVQCRIARGGVAAFGDEERAFELEERHRGRWLIGLPGGEGVAWTFRRGFPEVLDAPIDVFLQRYDRFAAVPWVRGLCLFDAVSSSVRDFVNRPWNPNWVEVEIEEHRWPGLFDQGYNGSAAVQALAGCHQVRQLNVLRFARFDYLSPPAVRVLATSPYLDGIKRLIVPADRSRAVYAALRARFGDRLIEEGEIDVP